MNQNIKNLMSSVWHDDERGAIVMTPLDLENYTKRVILETIKIINTASWPTWAEGCDAVDVYTESLKNHFGVK